MKKLFTLLTMLAFAFIGVQAQVHVTQTEKNFLTESQIKAKAAAGDLYIAIQRHVTSSNGSGYNWYINKYGYAVANFDADGSTTWQVVPHNNYYVLKNMDGNYITNSTRPMTVGSNIANATLFNPQQVTNSVDNMQDGYSSKNAVRWWLSDNSKHMNSNGANTTTTVQFNAGAGNWTCLFAYEVVIVPSGYNGYVGATKTINSAEWKTQSNWSLTDTWKGNGPGCTNSDMWAPIYLQDVTATGIAFNGWNLRLKLVNSSLTANIEKLQTNIASTIDVDKNSTLNLTLSGSNNNGWTRTFNIDGNLTINMDTYDWSTGTSTNTINLGTTGQFTFTASSTKTAPAASSFIIKATPTNPANKNTLTSRTLATFANVTVTTLSASMAATDGWTEVGSKAALETQISDGKFCYFEKSATGVTLWTYDQDLSTLTAEKLISRINATTDYTVARDLQSESNPFVGMKPYAETNALKEAVTAETPDADAIRTALSAFRDAAAVTLQAGKTYRIISAYPDFETKGDNKKKAIYSDGTGLIWKAIDVAADYYKSIWNVANINGNTLTLLNLQDAGYPQAVSVYDAQVPLSRTNVNTCTLTSLGEGQYNIKSHGTSEAFHCGGHNNGAGTSGSIVMWNGEKNSCSAWYIQEITDITMPTTGYYRIKNGKDDKYMQTTTNGVGAVSTSGAGINTIFSVTKNEDGTYYLKGDNGKYVQEASRSSQVKMTLTPVKYFITRDKENLWNFRAQAAVESDYDYHYLHTNNNTIVVGWSLGDNSHASRWTIEAVNDYTYYPVELTGGPTGAEMAIRVLTDGYTGSTVLYDGGFYAFTESAPTASSFADYEDDILETNDIAVANNKITASFTVQDITPIFTISDELTNVYYYIHNARNDGSYDFRDWYVRATKEDKVTVTNNGKTTNGAGVFQFYAAETTNPQGYPTYYIYNTGAQAWVKYNSATEGSNKVELVSDKTNANSWLIYTEDNGSYVDVIPGELKITNTAQSWNAHGGFTEGKQMGLYARSDGNSSWALESLTLDNDELATVMNNYVRYYAPVYTGSYEHAGELGYLKQEFIDGLSELADVNTLKSTWQNRGDNDYVRPESGHFYKLLCAGNKNQYIVDSNYNNNRVSVSATDEDNVWCYYKNKLIGYKSGCKLVNNNGFLKLGDAGNEGSDIDFRKTGVEGKMSIHFINNNSDRYAYGNGENQIDGGSSAPNDDYRWKISEVTSIPVTFKAAGLGYATFNCPVPVKIPSGVSAYVSKINGTKIKLYQIHHDNLKDGEYYVIPANTPVLLHVDGGLDPAGDDYEASFVISDYDGEGISGDDFYGTIAAEAMGSGTYYSLRAWTASGDTYPSKVGFYTKSGNLAGFKAWIHDDSSSARNFTIVFDGDEDPTGIVEALGLENDNVEIYDLNGRKLSSYKKGINIVNGKKVMIQ